MEVDKNKLEAIREGIEYLLGKQIDIVYKNDEIAFEDDEDWWYFDIENWENVSVTENVIYMVQWFIDHEGFEKSF